MVQQADLSLSQAPKHKILGVEQPEQITPTEPGARRYCAPRCSWSRDQNGVLVPWSRKMAEVLRACRSAREDKASSQLLAAT